jgi:charged multivesicular body protein 1
MSGVASNLKAAVGMQGVARRLGTMSRDLDRAMASMDTAAVSDIIEKFSTQFEDLGIQSQLTSDAMSMQVVGATPQDEVDALVRECADEAGLELGADMPSAMAGTLRASPVAHTPSATRAPGQTDSLGL